MHRRTTLVFAVGLATHLCSGCGAAQHPVGVSDSAPTDEPRVLERRPVDARGWPLEAEALPVAMRQIEEGYWLGALIQPGDVPLLRRLGIRLVLSAVHPGGDTVSALRNAGILQVDIPMGATLRHTETILELVDRFPPQEIFIHCRHGADRTGAIAAFLLVVKHGWEVADALYSVVYPTDEDTRGLATVMATYGVLDARPPDDPSVGIYSISGTGRGVGGMKVRNGRYERLVESTIEAMQSHRQVVAHFR